jgi:predicted RNA binding protein with dsRBD fold (UPF0201 family)
MSEATKTWFEVDKTGLAKILKRRGVGYIIFELVQNCWDTGAKQVKIDLQPVPGRSACTLTIEDDDPEGFKNLDHAYTLYAESEKKSDPSKRGFMNLGEKLVISACEWVRILSTKGTILFGPEGRSRITKKTEKGTKFEALIRMTRDEMDEVTQAIKRLIPPEDINTTFNGEPLVRRTPLHVFETTLPTITSDDEGFLKKTARKTMVRVYDVPQGGTAHLYEMGIPVVEVDLPWDIEVMQKVPLNADRDNVTPAYMKTLSVETVNRMHQHLKPEQAALPAIQETLADERIAPAAVQTVMTHQFGEKRAIFDPSDPEANRRLVSEGYTVIPGGTFSKDAWNNIRASGERSSGRISPSPELYSSDPMAQAARFIPEGDWTEGMRRIADYTHELAWKLIKKAVNIHFETGRMTDGWAANYGHGELTFNHDRLGKRWFDRAPSESLNDLLIHELSHEFGGHLTKEFDDALSRLGAKMVELALKDPEFFRNFGYETR